MINAGFDSLNVVKHQVPGLAILSTKLVFTIHKLAEKQINFSFQSCIKRSYLRIKTYGRACLKTVN